SGAFRLVGALERAGSSAIGAAVGSANSLESTVRITSSCNASADVVVDFSSGQGALSALEAAERAGAALLVGTTALDEKTFSCLRAASAKFAVLVAPNTSLGVAVLSRAAAEVARALGPGFEISIVEAHHSKKKDAPSGTALRLAKAVADAGAPVNKDQIVAI